MLQLLHQPHNPADKTVDPDDLPSILLDFNPKVPPSCLDNQEITPSKVKAERSTSPNDRHPVSHDKNGRRKLSPSIPGPAPRQREMPS